MPDADRYRLPRSVTPERYELELTPDLAAATFAGSVRIALHVNEPTAEIVLNAAELSIDDVRCQPAEGGDVVSGAVTLDSETERATISLSAPLGAGKHLLDLRFRGLLNDKLAGFYRSTFRDDAGTERVIATTQMEATDARRAFPCWDEPDRKAVFSVRLVVDDDLVAISNGEVIGEEAAPGRSGKKIVTFADTMPMSTYLVAFIVGPLELTAPADVDGTALRVAHVPGRAHLTDFAMEVGAHALRFFAGYFDIAYPAGKLDLIALPDFAFGAMENVGAVTFRETELLVDRQNASQAELERVADVVCHEIAHMWFGDLVTMRWWNGIWLNEAFATFMELLAVDAFRPEWERWVTFGTSRAGALNIDATSATRPVEFDVVSPADAEGMFDTLTYQKGASVVRMLEQYLGPDRFRSGIRLYMDRHRYANTETTDLWDAIEEASGDPVRSTMDSWIFQGGFPLVSVDVERERGSTLVLSQRRFRFQPTDDDAGARWQVPVIVRARAGDDIVEQRLLLDRERAAIPFGNTIDWAVVNAGGSGFYRTRYTSPSLRALTTVVAAELTPIERFNLVSDTWAAVLAGLTPVDDYVELVGLLESETDPDVWGMIVAPFELFERSLRPEQRAGLAAFVNRLVEPAFARVGWQPAQGENQRTARLRAILARCLGDVGSDEAVRRHFADLHAAYLADRSSVEPNLVGPMVDVLAATGDEARYETFLARFRRPETPQEEVRYLYGLAKFRDRALLRRTLEMTISGEVRTQNGPFVVNIALANPAGGDLVWEWVKAHWETLLERFPDNSHSRMVGGIVMLDTPALAADARAFLEAHPIKAGQRTVDQLLERLDVNVAFRQRESDHLARLFAQS